jgi:hypothetical protein
LFVYRRKAELDFGSGMTGTVLKKLAASCDPVILTSGWLKWANIRQKK